MMKIPVLIYHDVLPENLLDRLDQRERYYTLGLENFKAHADYIASAGITSVNTKALRQGLSPDRQRIYFTFDDGFESAYQCALILKDLGLTATFFIVTDFIGRDRYLKWDQVQRMSGMGMDIQSHTCSHPIMTELSQDRLVDELVRSKAAIEDQVGKTVDAISIPQGFENERILKTAREKGYQYIFTSRPGLFDPSISAPICRLSVYNRTSQKSFRRLAHQNRIEVAKQQTSKELLSVPKKILGNRNYHMVREKLLRLLRN